MATLYCNDEKRRQWNFGPSFHCDGDSTKCEYLVRFGKQEYCGYCPPRCTPHQVVRSQAGCLFCKYVTKSLSSNKCFSCLSAETRINYEDERKFVIVDELGLEHCPSCGALIESYEGYCKECEQVVKRK